MSRYLGLKVPQNLSDYALGAYLCAQCLDYQRISKRYVPEIINFIENTLCALAPEKVSRPPGQFPFHEPKTSSRINHPPKSPKRLAFYDCVSQDASDEDEESLKLAILETNLKLLGTAADTWNKLPAFFEVFEPALRIVQHLSKSSRSKFPQTTQISITKLAEKLNVQLKLAQLSRRLLELHHHRPLAIKMAIPKFEESYNPDKHYDPDRDRSEAAKLRKEFKREKKGAVRDLRKEGRAVARENLKEKKEKDAAYEKKFKRLISEIQGEEGQESKAYEREKEWRKKGKK
jgi:nucleolar protein 14